MGTLKDRVFYARKWEEDYRESFDEEDLNSIESIEVVAGDWGLSAAVEVDGELSYYGIHGDSSPLSVGDKLDPKQCVIIHLKRGVNTCEKLLYTGQPL